MKSIDNESLKEMLDKHKKWLNYDKDGQRFYLIYHNLKGFDFSNQNLRNAVLFGNNLQYANFENANLEDADLSASDLTGVNFKEANLKNTGLDVVTNIPLISYPMVCPEKGEFIGYKKLETFVFFNLCNEENKQGVYIPTIAKLKIPNEAKRSSSTSRKCRCNKAEVLEITSLDGQINYAEGKSSCFFFNPIKYKVGETIEIKDFDENRWNECSTGIHFFMTREEAMYY